MKLGKSTTIVVLFAAPIAVLAATIITMANHAYSGHQADDSANLQNAGHIYTLQFWLPFNQGDLIVVNWNDNKSSLHENAGAVTEMWVTIGAWTTGNEPPPVVCNKDSSVPGCNTGGSGGVVVIIETCVDGPDPDSAAFGEEGEEECAEPDPSPILLDLDRNQFHLSGGPAYFDIDADGQPESLTWVATGNQDAFLFLDRNGNGIVDDGSELFGNATLLSSGERAEHGYEALAEFDLIENGGNQDGVISDADSIFSYLGVWIDSNADGSHEVLESQSLTEAGVLTIEVDYRESPRTDSHGNDFRYIGQGTIEVNGQNKKMATTDVFFKLLPQ